MPTLFNSARWPIVFGLVFFIAGCQKGQPNPAAPGVAPAMVHTGAPLTEADGRAFGKQLEQAAAQGDVHAVSQMLRIAPIIDSSVSDLDMSARSRATLREMARRLQNSFAEQFLSVIPEGGSYTMLRAGSKGDRQQVIFRLMHPDGAINYHELTLIRYPDQQIGAEDIYIYAAGEQLSQTFRRLVLGIVLLEQKGLANLKPEERIYFEHMDEVSHMLTVLKNGQPAEALALFRKLPAELHKHKYIQLLALQAASSMNDEQQYLAEMERFRQQHPNDAAGELLAIDYNILKKDFPAALEAINRLDKSIGGDPHLDSLRAQALLELGKYAEARLCADKAILVTPKLAEAYWIRTAIAAREKNYDDMLACLKRLVENVDSVFDPEVLTNDERYVDFVKTPQYEEFLKWLAKRGE